jgi:predicted transcriptional regulator of viral defense system
MLGAVLWHVKAHGQPALQSVLERISEGHYRVHVLKGREMAAVFQHDYPDRLTAIAASVLMYRKFKDNGFYDQPRPIERHPN